MYWLEREDRDDPIPIKVIRHHDYLAVASTEVGVEHIDGAWTGPIATPEEILQKKKEAVAEEIYEKRLDMYVAKQRE